MITIDDFKKVELKVGKVISAEPVEGSEKLLKLQVDLGSDPSNSSGQDIRQILSGIAKYYQPEDLVGRQITVIVNLEPRAMMGLESQGMVLAAGDGDSVSLLVPDKDMPAGSPIK
jgi:methionine--tRNA ligase beta chain